MELCFILGHFLPFYPPNSLKNQNLKEKKKKKPGDTIILEKCTKNHDHMNYCPWHMAHNGCSCYFPFWAIFCPFTSLTANIPKNPNQEKTMEKTHGSIIILQNCTKNYDQMMYSSWDMIPDGLTDGRKKRHIEVGVPLKKVQLSVNKPGLHNTKYLYYPQPWRAHCKHCKQNNDHQNLIIHRNLMIMINWSINNKFSDLKTHKENQHCLLAMLVPQIKSLCIIHNTWRVSPWGAHCCQLAQSKIIIKINLSININLTA